MRVFVFNDFFVRFDIFLEFLVGSLCFCSFPLGILMELFIQKLGASFFSPKALRTRLIKPKEKVIIHIV